MVIHVVPDQQATEAVRRLPLHVGCVQPMPIGSGVSRVPKTIVFGHHIFPDHSTRGKDSMMSRAPARPCEQL